MNAAAIPGIFLSAAVLLLSGCGSSGSSGSGQSGATALSAQAALGEKIFKDTSLSASGAQSCATCHDPAFGHSPSNALAVQLGGPASNQQGIRKTPGIRYLLTNTPFFFDDEGTPTGGFFWDGRAATPAEQAAEPFLNSFEMANADKASVVTKLAAASYASEFKSVYGANIFSDVDGAYLRMTLAIQQYEREDGEFNSYTSKYDAFLQGKASLTQQELRGLALFSSPTKGNCAGCHPSAKGADGSLPLFTDFTYDNLGVPRNPAITRNADPAYFDLGLCQRADLTAHTDLCGAFKVPSLRNVALRKAFFHNGKFTTLKDALTFYVQRDTNPEKFYPLVGGVPQKFDDLPPQYHANVNTTEVPYNRSLGDAPALTDAEIDDVIVFLGTLTDGYTQ
ncbi:MAG TPA: cytochrome c peroxidase [Burkholderiales bacterium]|nr:cytochrome c peroxidase [Burkholderiales bacterium]